MPYRSRCPACNTASSLHTWPSQARKERQRHRDECHGGRPVDGDDIRHGFHNSRGILITIAVCMALVAFLKITGMSGAELGHSIANLLMKL
ncbi:hypothetical protein ABZ502_17680 [Streptomyces abikoensis]|uniref:hypothetical protein n=1 Tax=Streptomyces abikoensis TaxID=97398 RepID=UPI0033E8DB76